jgi:hypothetical protein
VRSLPVVVPSPPSPSSSTLFGLFAAPAAWAVQGGAAWLIDARACAIANDGTISAAARTASLGISVVAAIIAIVALLMATDRWRNTREDAHSIRGKSRPAFVAAAAMFVSASFLVGIALTGFAAATLPICASMR